MKKALAILLIPIFFITTSFGVVMTSHLCQGVLKEVGIKVKGCCMDVDKGGCCKIKLELIKVKDNFVKTNIIIQLDNFFINSESTITLKGLEIISTLKTTKSFQANAPPSKYPLYIVHSSLII